MTEFYFIRHGNPDYSEIDKRKYIGFGNDLANLSDEGVNLMHNIAKDKILKDADIIISSPYTRTMHSASILSKDLNLELKVELDIMEWIPDKTYMYDDYAKVVAWRATYEENDGKHSRPEDNWEEKKEIQNRVINTLKKYNNYKKVIVVTHGMVLNALTGVVKPNYGQIVKYNLPDSLDERR